MKDIEKMVKEITGNDKSFEEISDKLVWLLSLYQNKEFTKNEKAILEWLADMYDEFEVVENPLVFADYNGANRVLRTLFKGIEDILIAELDLYLTMLIFNNPDLELSALQDKCGKER